MTSLRPFFNFYGSKWRFSPKYGEPRFERVVEPFAGSASYSLHFHEHQVELYDVDPVIAGLWKYLIAATPDEIMELPAEVGHVDNIEVCQEAKWLIGFWLNKGGTSPKLQASTWAKNPVSTYWGERIKERIASQVPAIKHWQITQASYSTVPNEPPATWLVDPPYNNPAGRIYKHSDVDYEHLGSWCKERAGQVIVCEQEGATWLPFVPFLTTRAMEGKKGKKVSKEAIWTNEMEEEEEQMSEVRGTVLAVNGKSVNGKTIYEVAFSDGQTYATFNNEKADAAKRLQGQPAVMQTTLKTVSKNDKVYTNYYLDSIEPGIGAVQSETTPQAIAIKEDYQRKMAPEVEQRVTRLSVIATAFQYAGAAGLGEEEALALAKRLYNVAYYGKPADVSVPPVIHEVPPPEIQAQVAEVVGATGTPTTPDW